MDDRNDPDLARQAAEQRQAAHLAEYHREVEQRQAAHRQAMAEHHREVEQRQAAHRQAMAEHHREVEQRQAAHRQAMAEHHREVDQRQAAHQQAIAEHHREVDQRQAAHQQAIAEHHRQAAQEDQIERLMKKILTSNDIDQFMLRNEDDKHEAKLRRYLTEKEVFEIMKWRDDALRGGVAAQGVAAASGEVAAASGGIVSGPCEFPIWVVLTQSQRECFMDDAGNIVTNPTEGNKIRNRAVETLLASFFKGAVAVPTTDPCPHSVPDDTPANREAAWDVLCDLLPGDQKGALRDEAFDFEVFHDPVILSTNGTTYERAQLMGWFADHPEDPNGTEVTPAEQASPTPNTRLKQFIDTFNLGGSPDRQGMLGGRKLTRRRKSKSARHMIRGMRRKTKTMRRKTSKAKSKR